MRKHSVKNERINAEMQKELSRILREEVKDPRIPVMISVVAAEVAPDLKTCKAYISALGDDKVIEDTKAALGKAAGFIRRELAHSLNLRITPEITYCMDQSIEYGVTMSHKIDVVMEEQNRLAAERERREAAENEAADGKED